MERVKASSDSPLPLYLLRSASVCGACSSRHWVHYSELRINQEVIYVNNHILTAKRAHKLEYFHVNTSTRFGEKKSLADRQTDNKVTRGYTFEVWNPKIINVVCQTLLSTLKFLVSSYGAPLPCRNYIAVLIS